MSRIPPLAPEDVPELEDIFKPYLDRMGFVPTSQRVMAHYPPLVRGFVELARAIWSPEAKTPMALRAMVGFMASRAAGCLYCQAHTGSNAGRAGVEEAKIAAIWEYETSDLFTDAERAALRFAQCAASVPNMVTDDVFAELARHYDTQEQAEIMAVISYYGFLNRWNDSMATQLEAEPVEFAERALAGAGWIAGKHASAAD